MKKLAFAIVILLMGASQSGLACGGGGGGGYGRCRGISTGEGTLNFQNLVDLSPIAVLDSDNVLVRAVFADGSSSLFQINEGELNQVSPRIADRFRRAYQALIDGPSI